MEQKRDEALQALLDERAIQRVLVQYTRGVDRCDEALLADAYHEDSYDEHGSFRGTGAEFAAWVVKLLGRAFAATSHRTSNATIELAGDDARVESYVVAYHRTRTAGDAPPQLIVVGGRYLDHFARRQGVWKIARRVVVIDWSQVTPIEHTFPAEDYVAGDRFPNDASYADFFGDRA